LRTFAISIDDGDQLFVTLFCGADQNKDAGSFFVESDVEIDAVSPPIDVTFLAQLALAPCLVILFPRGFEPHDIGCRQPAGSFSQNRFQRFGKIARRYSLQVEGRDQCIDARSPSHVLGQDRTRESAIVAVSDPWLTNPHRADTGLYFSFGQVTVTDHQPLTVFIPAIAVGLDVLDHFVFDRRLQHFPGSFLQQSFQKRRGHFGYKRSAKGDVLSRGVWVNS
jgi:hypothetical protein